MDKNILHQKLNTIKTASSLDMDRIDQAAGILEKMDDWDLLRLNPIAFANKYHWEKQEAIDFFVHAAKVGLFDFSWNLICPHCGSLEFSHKSVDEVEQVSFHCSVCQVDINSDLDDHVEVAFTIQPGVKRLNLNRYANLDNYHRYYFSPNYKRSEMMLKYMQDTIHDFQHLLPDVEKSFAFEIQDKEIYRFLSFDMHSVCYILGVAANDKQQFKSDIDITKSGFSTHQVNVPASKATLNVRNLSKMEIGVVFQKLDIPRIMSILKDYPPTFYDYLSGKELLNHQSFRELFRIQTMSTNLKLNIRSLTLLFTDLRGSTMLYDQTGDVYAYSLIQEHFDVLTRVVKQHSGAIIKTMGDAIMASFSNPLDGVKAAIDMINGINQLNQKIKDKGHNLGLKIGLHEGSALAVNADDRIDYFGQTVNIAARVQGLAAADEIWISEPIYKNNAIMSLLNEHSYQEEKHLVSLKGVEQKATVYRYFRVE